MDDFGKPESYSFSPDDNLKAMTDAELDAYENRLRKHIERLDFVVSSAEDPRKIESANDLLPMLHDELRRVRDTYWERHPINFKTNGNESRGVWTE